MEQIYKLENAFASDLRGKTDKPYQASISIAYLLVELKSIAAKNVDLMSIPQMFEAIQDDEIRWYVQENLSGVELDLILQYYKYDLDLLKSYVLFADDRSSNKAMEISSPDSISRLAIRILNIQEGESVLDSCAGVGSFLVRAYHNQPGAKYSGVEMNIGAACLLKMRSNLIDGEVKIKVGDALSDIIKGEKFDKLFSNYPFCVNLRTVSDNLYGVRKFFDSYPGIIKGGSADWVFNYNLVESMKESGKAVAIMPLGGLFNTSHKNIRAMFLKRRLINSIILLPSKLFASTSIPVAMVVFSHNNEGVRMVDASENYLHGRRQNLFSEEDISNILDALENDIPEKSRKVGIEELLENEYVLEPQRYLAKKELLKNGVEFESVIKSVRRGASCTAADLDGMVSQEPTDFQYIMLSNIKNGVIDEELPYIKEIPENYKKYCVESGDLLLSKNGYPFKVVVAEVPDGKQLLANGNLYIIRLDTNKVNPYYIKAFLESEKGIAALKEIAVGTAVLNIGVAQLNTLSIPLIPLAEQEEFVKDYVKKLNRIAKLRREIADIEDELKASFPEGN